MFCHHCGAAAEESARYCLTCGRPLNEPAATPAATVAGPVRARTLDWIGEGWKLVQQDWLLLALMTIVMSAVSSFTFGLLQGALTAGFHYVFLRKMLTGRFDFGDIFKGFQYFVPTLVAALLVMLLTLVASLACLIPGLVVAAMYMFVYLFIIDRKMDFWPAMQASHAIVKQDYFGFTMFLLAFAVLHIAGILCCLVGILITVPIQFAAVTVAYRETVGIATTQLD